MHKISFFLVALVLVGMAACTKDPEVTNEEELITTLIYTLKPTTTGDDVVLTFRDIDGDGGTAPQITISSHLKVGETYAGTLSLLNESKTPPEDITTEIKTEGLDHQFFFTITGPLAANVSITYDDKDTNNNPIGINSKLKALIAGSGKLGVILRHLPSKNGNGVATGNISNAGGETDLEVYFDIEAK